MKTGHGTRGTPALALVLAAQLLSACTSTHPLQTSERTGREGARSLAGRHLIVAHIPRAQAPTPSVARARLNGVLMKAKREADRRLCRGRWIFLGKVGEVLPPEPATIRDGEGAWRLTLSWSPRLASCNGVDRASYFRTLSRSLPAWVRLRDGVTLAWFRAGREYSDAAGIQLARAGTP